MTVRTRHGNRLPPRPSALFSPHRNNVAAALFTFVTKFSDFVVVVLFYFFCFWLLWPRQSSRHWQSFGKRGAFLNGHVLQFKRRQQAEAANTSKRGESDARV